MATRKSRSSKPAARFPQWQPAYESALHEADRIALFKRIEVAEAAILTRRDSLEPTPDAVMEQSEINRALSKLSSLKKDVLRFSIDTTVSLPLRKKPAFLSGNTWAIRSLRRRNIPWFS